MKKFFALVVLLCAVMISSTASAEVQFAPLCKQDAPTLIQKLREIPDMKIWDMEKKLVNGVSGYSGYFGESKNNILTIISGDGDRVKAVSIESQFDDDELVLKQMLELSMGTLVIAGVSIDDVTKLMQEMVSDMQKALSKNSNLKKYEQNFFAYTAQDRRNIVVNFSAREIRSDFGEFKFIIFAK